VDIFLSFLISFALSFHNPGQKRQEEEPEAFSRREQQQQQPSGLSSEESQDSACISARACIRRSD